MEDCLEGSLDRVLFAAEPELPRILLAWGYLRIHQM